VPGLQVVSNKGEWPRGNQQIEIRGIARLQDVGVQALDPQDPAQLPRQIAIFALRENCVQRPAIGKPGRLGASGRLRKFLLGREGGKLGLDLARRR
jgi:hypothetical protein